MCIYNNINKVNACILIPNNEGAHKVKFLCLFVFRSKRIKIKWEVNTYLVERV